MIARALSETAQCLNLSEEEVKEKVEGSFYHDWVSDPFTRGAYAYVRVGGFGSREILGRPVEDTLFFAGEATSTDGSAGTVHGAIRSGVRAARQCVERRSQAA